MFIFECGDFEDSAINSRCDFVLFCFFVLLVVELVLNKSKLRDFRISKISLNVGRLLGETCKHRWRSSTTHSTTVDGNFGKVPLKMLI